MKKISLLCAVAIAGLSLAACGNNSSKKNTTSKQTSSKVVKKHHKKHVNKKKTSSSSSSSATASSASQQNSQQTQPSNGQQQAASNGDNGLPPASNAYDFAQKYGVSPALWKMQHYGMSAHDALMSTPENMRTTGENQTVTDIQQGYIDPNTLNSK